MPDGGSSRPRIDQIVVSADDAAPGAYPDQLPRAVDRFVHQAVGVARYGYDDLPVEAVMSSHLFLYRGEVEAGGHATCLANTGLPAAMQVDVARLLATLGQDDLAALFADYVTFVERRADRLAGCSGGFEHIDPAFFGLDDRAADALWAAAHAAHTVWLRDRPWLRVVPDAEYAATIARLTGS